MSNKIRKITAFTMALALMLQVTPITYASEQPVIKDSAICAIKEIEGTDSNQKEEDLQAEKINEAFTKAKETLKKKVTIKVDKVDKEKLQQYVVPGPLVPYVRSAVLVPKDNQTIEAEIDYTTWYQAIKAYKEPKVYENQISDTAKQTLVKAKEIIKELNLEDEKSAYIKEKAIHDYIISKAKYSEVINGDIAAAMHGAEGVILNQDGMCRSYAESMQLFMEMLGVESKIIMGMSKKSYDKHVWNMVKLDDGNWHFVDLTWDEVSPDEPGKVLYDYFNVSFRILNQDHAFEEWQQLEDTEDLSYFPYADIVAYCSEDVVDVIKKQLSNGKREGKVYINYNTNVNEVMTLVLQAMKKAESYGKVKLDKETTKIYSFSISD